jgi:hypothetical protein
MAITPKKVSVTGSTSLLDSKTFPSIVWTETKTAGSNTFTVDASTTTAVLTLTGASGDVVKINGYSGDFIASLSGAKLTLASNTQKISVTLAAASKLELSFTDKPKVVVDYAAKTLDGHVLTKTAWKIDGQTKFGADALKAALTDASGKYYTTLAEAIKSDNQTEIVKAISDATGTKITTVDALKLAYNPTFSVAAVDTAALEGTDATFTVTLSAPQAVATTVNVAIAGVGGATLDADYKSTATITGTGVTSANSTLTFAPGVTTATLKFPLLSDSVAVEAGEGVKLTLTDATGSIAKVSATAATSTTINITDVPAVNATLEASKTVAASGLADTFKLVAPTSDIETTISGFDYLADKILLPAGAGKPTALPNVANDGANNGAVDLTWSNGDNQVIIHLTGVSPATEVALQMNAVSSIFGTY